MSSSEGSGPDPDASDLQVGVEPSVDERFRLQSRELILRARSCSERVRRLDLALEERELSSAAIGALAAERDQLSLALLSNYARLRALCDGIRLDCPGVPTAYGDPGPR